MKIWFIKPIYQSKWIANVMPIPKKDGKVRMCVDFRDLNKACPKDDFPLPHTDVLVDNTTISALMSFMDGFSRYNQIKKASRDMTKTTFTNEWGIYCYTIMPFGLKNAGEIYQRMATTLLHDIIHNKVEVYVDDMIMKYRLRLNLQKCTFRVIVRKLLGFLVSDKGIEVHPSKIKDKLKIPPPKNEKEIRGFLGSITIHQPVHFYKGHIFM